MNFAMIGPTGAGKGTQCAALAKHCSFEHLSTGDLFRENLEQQTALGLLARKYMDRGELVPDELVEAMIEERVRKCDAGRGLLFDGFPRTEYQARFLDELFAKVNRKLDGVLLLDLNETELRNRLQGRLVCRQCQAPYNTRLHAPARAGVCDLCGGELIRRHDDDPERVLARVQSFRRAVGPVLEYYRSTGRLRIIEVGGSTEAVCAIVKSTLKEFERGQHSGTGAVISLPVWHRPAVPPLTGRGRAGLDIVLLGGPGSGKGTQAEMICAEFKLPHIATGDLFRENLHQATELGRHAKTYMDRGELVPDEITDAMVRERLARPDARKGFVLDGFPRTLPQAEALHHMMVEMDRRLAGVLYLNVSDEEIVARLSGRLICRRCQAPFHRQFKPPHKPGVCDLCGGELYQRDDDHPETVRARLKTFHAQTEPLIEYYRRHGLLKEIRGEGEVAKVTALTLQAARELKAS